LVDCRRWLTDINSRFRSALVLEPPTGEVQKYKRNKAFSNGALLLAHGDGENFLCA
jgi:hypothetical protein